MGWGIFAMLLFFFNFLTAQDNQECIVNIDDPNHFIVTPEQIANAASSLPVVFNMAFWQINDEHGNYQEPLTEGYVLTAIANMNMVYNEFGIFFKYRGLQEINSPPNVVHELYDYGISDCVTLPGPDPDGFMRLSQCQRSELWQWVNANNYKVPNTINVYVPFGTTDFGGAGGSSKLIFNRNGLTGAGLVHEIGHTFGLHHTHGAGQDNISWRHPTDPSRCEHVTRDESITEAVDPVNYYNANAKGDWEKSTASAPNYRVEYCHFNGLPDTACYGTDFDTHYVVENENSCSYTGDDLNTDCAGSPYDIFDADVRNYMAYTRNSCRDSFTPDQIAKMQARAVTLTSLQTTIESLYEPYKGEYYYAGPLVNGIDYKPLFQPGFDYWFVECSGPYPQPADYNSNFSYNPSNRIAHYTKDEEDYGAITHPNHTAIKIGQVETALGRTNIQKCYNNFNLSPSSGTLFTFNDGVLNTNVTIQPLDSLGINNPQLIDNLDVGLYKIEKQYEDNAKQETVIIKGN